MRLTDKDERLAERLATEIVTRAFARAHNPEHTTSDAWASRALRRIRRCLENQ